MKQQLLFNRTLRDTPADAETAGHRLMLRAGLIRQLSSGIYSHLPLGLKALHKIQAIVRKELDAAGAQEMLMPALHPAELWKESGRWDLYGPELMRLEDRNGRSFALGATHEEVITALVRDDIQTYKKLPVLLYQFQTKFRDERRPRFGLLRGREFLMKDAYSFDRTPDGLDKSYLSMYDAYVRIFTGCGLRFRAVEADSGAIGGTDTHEFMALAEIGEDTIVHCANCGYAANLEKAAALQSAQPAAGLSGKPASPHAPEPVYTPGITTIAQLCEHLGVEARQIIKSIALKADGEPIVVLLRGDDELNEIKLKTQLGTDSIEMLSEAEIENELRSHAGFIGPLGLPDIRLLADESLRGITDAIAGANRKDYHVRHICPERDLPVLSYADLRLVKEHDLCVRCKSGLSFMKGIEVGHIFKLGTKYSALMGAVFTDESGDDYPMIMGCYGIGVSRLLAAIVEQHHDERGIVWPAAVAPFAVHLVTVNPLDEVQMNVSEALYRALSAAGIDTLWDDREERPGVKFNDADLLGMPMRITVGKKAAEGTVECKERRSGAQYEWEAASLLPRLQTFFKQEVFTHE